MARCFVTRALPGPALDRLRAAHDVEVWPEDLPPEPDDLRGALADAEGLLCLLTDRVDADVLEAAPRLRAISNYAVGADNVDLAAAAERRIPVGVTPGVLTDATADLAMALLLAAARRLPEAERAVREGAWRTWEPAGWLGLELRGATLAVVGFGRIGQAVAQRAQAFGMGIVTVGRGDDLHAALARADAVSLHVPLTDATKGMLGADELALLRPGAVVVNTARGGLLDTQAVLGAERLTFALDVTDPEPLPRDHALLRAPNVLVVPHIGSATHAARERMSAIAVDNLLAGLDGRPLPHAAT